MKMNTIFDTAKFNNNQRDFFVKRLESEACYYDYDCDRRSAKDYYRVMHLVENKLTIDYIGAAQIILDAMGLYDCNNLKDVKNNVMSYNGYDMDDFNKDELEKKLMEDGIKLISDEEAKDLLNAKKMLAQLLADFWQKQAA
jgi:hypothetical protein